MAEARELGYEECRALLAGRSAGRVAICTPDGPHIVPLNFVVVDESLILRTSPFSVVATYGRNAKVAFEIDEFDEEHQLGWSVVVRGRGDIVTDPQELERIRDNYAPQPWVDGTRNLFFRIRWSELTGRRLNGFRAPESATGTTDRTSR